MKLSPHWCAPGRAVLQAILVILLSCLQVHAFREIIVDTTLSGFDADDGVTTLDEAVAAANWDDRIIFAAGLNGTIEPVGTLELRGDVQVIGPGSLDILIDGGGVRQIFKCGGWLNRFENLVLIGGTTNDGYQGNGGAIFSDGNLQLVNCTFIGNRTDMTGATGERMGAAVFKEGGLLTVESCTFYGNGFDDVDLAADEFAAKGGAIAGHGTFSIDGCLFEQNTSTDESSTVETERFGSCIYYSSAPGITGTLRCTIENSSFLENSCFNTASDPISDHGRGTVYNDGQELLLRNCYFRGNQANHGGCVYSDQPLVGGELVDPETWAYSCTFEGNYAGGFGGAIHSEGPLTTEWVLFIENEAGYDGGAVHGTDVLNITSCYFKGNEVEHGSGGAIYFTSGDLLTLKNSLLILNRAALGGAALNTNGPARLSHCTILRNTSGTNGIFAESAAAVLTAVSDVQVSHCMIAENLVPQGIQLVPGRDVSQAVVSSDFNLVEILPPAGESSFDPKPHDLVGVPPHLFTYPNGVLMLVGDSRGINEGDSSITSVPGVTHDMFGNPRVAGGVIDIGAIEMRQEVLNMHTWLSFYGLSNPFGDDDKDGIHNIVEAMLGTVPISGKDGSPVKESGGGGSSPGPLPRGPRNGGSSPLVVEFPLDERMTFLEGRLQTSPDLVNWTDRVTYVPLGGGLGIQRSGNGGVSLIESARAGYLWKMREEIDPAGGRIFVRMDVREP